VLIGLSEEKTERIIAIEEPAPTVAATTEEIITSFRRIRSGSFSVSAVWKTGLDGKRYREIARLGYHSIQGRTGGLPPLSH
jgi:hypothetical protein